MTFNDIYNQFTKSTKENFPVDVCVKNEIRSDVFNSNVPYLCLVTNKRIDNYFKLVTLYPFISKNTEFITTYGWVGQDNFLYGNIENSTHLWNEFVVGFREFEEDDPDKCLWDDFKDKINEQYDNLVHRIIPKKNKEKFLKTLTYEQLKAGYIRFNVPNKDNPTCLNGEVVFGWVSPEEKEKYDDDTYNGKIKAILTSQPKEYYGRFNYGDEVILQCHGDSSPTLDPEWIKEILTD